MLPSPVHTPILADITKSPSDVAVIDAPLTATPLLAVRRSEPCSVNPTFTFNEDRCRSFLTWEVRIPHPPDCSSVSLGRATVKSRELWLPTVSGDSTILAIDRIEADECLPGPSTCGFSYRGTECPEGYMSVSLTVQNNIRTTYCCFSASAAFDPPLNVYYPKLFVRYGTVPTTSYIPACRYTYSASDFHSFPKEATKDVCGDHILHQRAIAILAETTHPSTATATTKLPSPKPTENTIKGKKIGIGVGVSLGVLSLIAAAVGAWLILRRRRLRQEIQPAEDIDPCEKRSLDETLFLRPKPLPEIDGNLIYELSDSKKPDILETEQSKNDHIHQDIETAPRATLKIGVKPEETAEKKEIGEQEITVERSAIQ